MTPHAPHLHRVDVAASPRDAFALFTTGMGEWWDPDYTPDATTFTGVDLQPFVGGELAMVHGGERHVVGRVLRWDEGHEVALELWLGMPAEAPSELTVTFVEEGEVCLVELVHGGWTAENLEHRRKFTDWPLLLGRFARACAR